MDKSKKGKIIGSIISGLVTVGVAVGVFYVLSNNGEGSIISPPDPPNPPQAKLANVENIQYDNQSNLLTWDDVTGADAYNVSINGEIQQVDDNYYPFALVDQETEFKVQAYDTSGRFLASEWSDPYVVTLQQQESLVAKVNEFATNIVSYNVDLKKVISLYAEGNNVYTTAIYRVGSRDRLAVLCTDCGKEVESIQDALDILDIEDPAQHITLIDTSEIKNYDTASSFLSRREYGDQIQELARSGYSLSFVTSQAIASGDTAVSLVGILKATYGRDIRYFSVDLGFRTGEFFNEQYQFTNAVEMIDADDIYENTFVEMTGDFADYATQLEELQNTNETTQDYGNSL